MRLHEKGATESIDWTIPPIEREKSVYAFAPGAIRASEALALPTRARAAGKVDDLGSKGT